MRYFLKRYFGWYLWLGIYTTAIGGLIGLLCFSVSFLPFLVIFFFSLYPAALVFAAPLNLVMLPIAFHLLRNRPGRQICLRLVGMAGGFVSPVLGALAWSMFDERGPFRGLFLLNPLEQSLDRALGMVGLSAVGLIAGFFCAGLFNKHGERASIFDVNAALAALQQQEPQRR